ncbi:MAG: branched-chain amino acid transporter AzlC [Clostridiales bacterium]|nr:branched-chain amino acid transporter AzlC [Clostridiales bacterium]
MQKKNFKFALEKTAPISFGFIFLGIAFGVLMNEAGYNFVWSFLAGVFIYAGSMQFVMVSLLASGASLLTVALMTLLINSRHIFYGLGLVEHFKSMGKKYPYMVFSLTDETFSILTATEYPEEIDKKKASFLIAIFCHIYWVVGCTLGGLLGPLIPFDARGIEFSMTALFLVLLINGLKEKQARIPALIGALSALLFLLLLGPEKFLLPSLTLAVFLLEVFKKNIEKTGEGKV